MTRAVTKRDTLAPSLFPFLAVLLCTVGSLIVILVVAVFQAQASAKSTIEEEVGERQEFADELEVASMELAARREQQVEALAEQRSMLSHFESAIDRAQREIEQLEKQLSELESGKVGANATDIESEVVDLQKKIVDARDRLEEKKKEQANKKPAYAIVPYGGSNGTTRRPIYLECTRQGVIIQPEGILIGIEDLRPPYGPGNPVDAALRTIRNEYERAGVFQTERSSPYPLLVVRPDGIKSYSLARNAMASWDDQFGYELIAADLPLAFPPSLPGMKEKLEQSMVVAKERHQALLAALPAPLRRAAMEDDFDEPEDLQPSNDWGDDQPVNRRTGGASLDQANGNWHVIQEAPSTPNSSNVGASNMLANRSGVGYGMNGYGGNSSSSGQLPGQPGQPGLPSQQGQLGQRGQQGQFGQPGSAMSGDDSNSSQVGSNSVSGGSSGSQDTAATGGSSAGSSSMAAGSPQAQSSNSSGGGGGNASSPSSMSFQSDETTRDGLPADPPSMGYQGREPRKMESAASNKSSSSDSSQEGNRDVTPISVTMGQGWAESRMKGKSTPVVREIRIRTYANDWHIMDEGDPSKVESIVSTEAGPQIAGKQLATVIKRRVDGWGMAVAGGYWKPRVTLEVYPQSEVSAQRLQRLLEGSGVEISIQQSSQLPSLRRLPQIR